MRIHKTAIEANQSSFLSFRTKRHQPARSLQALSPFWLSCNTEVYTINFSTLVYYFHFHCLHTFRQKKRRIIVYQQHPQKETSTQFCIFTLSPSCLIFYIVPSGVQRNNFITFFCVNLSKKGNMNIYKHTRHSFSAFIPL